MPERRREDHVRIARMNDDAADTTRLLQTTVLPGAPRVDRTVDAVTDRDVGADEGLAGARPDHVGVGRCDGERADRRGWRVVEDRFPGRAGVGALEDASRGPARVVDLGVTRHAGDGGHPVAHRPYVAELQLAERVRGDLVLGRQYRGHRAGERTQDQEQASERPNGAPASSHGESPRLLGHGDSVAAPPCCAQ